jgi:glutaredoxin
MKRAFAVLSVLLAAGFASAQTTYRWTDPASGRTVYSDQPPPPAARQSARASESKGDDAGQAPQSYAVRAAAEKFPVTLYTSADCGESCQQARALLNGRGVPFNEKLVAADKPELDELKKLTGGEVFVPYLLVGKQTSRGFEAGTWNGLLDLAGYPKSAPYGSKPSGAFAR